MPSISRETWGRPFAYLDPASGRTKAKKPNARSALVVCCHAPPAYILILYTWAARASTTDITNQIFRVWDLFHPQQIAIETAGQQYLLYSHVVDEALRRNIRLPVTEGKQYTEDAKLERIRTTVIPMAAQGRLCYQSHQTDFRSELTDFPRGATVDLLDACAGCLSIMPKPRPVVLAQANRDAVRDYLQRARAPLEHYEHLLRDSNKTS